MVQSIVLTGPTASGKTGVALEVAASLGNLEIINADSVCFYRHFDIGSAKPTEQERSSIPHHLIDVANPEETYHAARFLEDCTRTLGEIHSRGKRALIVGGSGFYLKALRFGLWDAPPTSPEFRKTLESLSSSDLHSRLLVEDPVQASRIAPQDRYRIIRALEILALSGKKPSELEASMPSEPDPRFQLWVIDREAEDLEARIRSRIRGMINAGWLEETSQLRSRYPESKTLHSLGYQQVLDHLDGISPSGRKIKPGMEGLEDEIGLAHRQLAKQQRTWFKNLGFDRHFLLDRDRISLKEALMGFYQ